MLRAVAAAAGRLPGGGGAAALACLAATCRRWCGVVGQDGELWEAMCRCGRRQEAGQGPGRSKE